MKSMNTKVMWQIGSWQVEKAVQAYEADLKNKSIIGHHQHSTMSWDMFKSSKVPPDK